MPQIKHIEIRACRADAADPVLAATLPGGSTPDFLVVTLRTHEGLMGTSFGFGGLNAVATGAVLSTVKPFFLGRDPFDRERNWQEFRKFNRKWNHVPIYAYGPYDNACWDIVGKQAGLPVYKLLGPARDRVPTYASSMFLPDTAAYAAEALSVMQAGFHGYKLHPPGTFTEDLAAYRAVREAVGRDFALMADPVAAYRLDEALRVGRVLEQLNYLWFEEPLWDEDFRGLRTLAQSLDIPIAATETLAGQQYASAHYAAEGAVDIIRTDVSWRGGITAVMRTAHVAEALGLRCELHTCIYHALEIVNLHCALAISNAEFFEVLYPMSDYDFGLKTPLRIEDGYIYPPEGPGLGIDYDWDYIDDHTVEIY
ncbi:enolase C-terminal domain-like protein [Streptomyces nigrescens]|uniref:Mandelate racemase/muconate lactonizing enzyme C-terminal domain-containing protein n=1 Tax=Streptomyces nigrescens TaxID=1920 RepID=A0ABY7J0Z2_STRNI|nr:enolase C-terminal domain-like protein [Streptomyces nigrescens]WAU03814.1 hypothetical protein STRNI_002008 [Streptomyces nigrescens]